MKFYRSLQPIKAMTFDLDDTLYDNYSVMITLEKQFLHWLNQHAHGGQEWTKQEWHQRRKQTFSANRLLGHDMTKLRQATLQAGLSARGIESDQQQTLIRQAMGHVYHWRNQVEISDSTHQIMAQLQQKLPLVAITNGNVDVNEIGLSDYFEFTLHAGPDGAAKPHADLFDKACQKLDIAAQHILHVGDHLISDVAGAQAAGYQSAWLNLSGDSLSQHKKINVLPNLEIDNLASLLELIA